MASELPTNPDLDFLRKQAKKLLRGWRTGETPAPKRARLADALHAVARSYGFASWPALRSHVKSLPRVRPDPLEEARRIFHEQDAEGLRALLSRHPELKRRLDEPLGPFDSPAVTLVRTREMLDALLDAGADINARSRWWAGGFGLLDQAEPELAAYALRRGARLTAHAAARLGMEDELRSLIAANPACVHERGGDGQTPLHFASTVGIARILLEAGADIDARDIDHDSTPAQYMVRSRPEVARELVRRGCATDLLMAAALDDRVLARRLLDADPECIRLRVTDEYFPTVDPHKGGTIYQWELGWYVSAVQVAVSRGHREMAALLLERCPPEEKLLNACWLHDRGAVDTLRAEHPRLAAELSASAARHTAHAARNRDAEAVRLMVHGGFTTRGRGQHNATALHWAAWHGHAEMVSLLLPLASGLLEDRENEFSSTPLGWAIHGSENGWERERGDYPRVVELLLDAGAVLPERAGGTPAVRSVLEARMARS